VRLALKRLGLANEAHDVVFVGDSPFDLHAGRAAGTHTAAALWGPFSQEVLAREEPDFYLTALEEVLQTSPRRT
jgi:pyrophosphatase PpaX